ncbi:hypothetical protein CONLIGDRAFT_688528 [Coniochaeta ligniaria NRRL 30616]|uniref:Peptidase S8/S53 domain-containing protein n=1 Tax=Coniochaeta ligniaria NRRL 30616 TaxID=1408157 RepID=A0A1J7JMK8_9PEZI|nr:hypothetical protein CONLIGDRAFT_688528 [Coniochaeta ligniaria NRRL 30616]
MKEEERVPFMALRRLIFVQEFPHVSATHLFTPEARILGRKAGEEDNSVGPPYYGTCAADKALGAQYGAAKKATLTTVVMTRPMLIEKIAAFTQIRNDIWAHPERRKFSVVTMSIVGPNINYGHPLMPFLRNVIGNMMEMDVPVVVCAGNDAMLPEHQQGGLDKDSGSIARRYNQGTMDEVSLGIDYAPGLDFKPNMPDCVRYMLAELTDGCDGNDPNNPENFKGGGTMKVGPVAYQIGPQTARQPAKSGLQGGCDGTYKVLWDEFTMWGNGFASSDFGAALKGQVDDCALLPNTWDFQYGLGSDGREWGGQVPHGRVPERAGKEAGAPGDFGCSGSG